MKKDAQEHPVGSATVGHILTEVAQGGVVHWRRRPHDPAGGSDGRKPAPSQHRKLEWGGEASLQPPEGWKPCPYLSFSLFGTPALEKW